MYKRQIHEGADARKIDEKYLTGQIRKGSWKVEEHRMIKKQNALLQKVIATFGKVSGALSMWRECLNDIRRKQRSNPHDGSNDYTDRGTTEYPVSYTPLDVYKRQGMVHLRKG